MREQWLDDLDAWMLEDSELPDDQQPIEPGPGDQALVDRELWKLGILERQEAEIREVARQGKARIDTWLADRLEKLENRRQWPQRVAEGWMRAQVTVTKVKTVTLPAGVLRLRPGRPSVVVDGEEQAIKWAEENDHPGWVERKPRLLKGEVGKAVQTDKDKERPLARGQLVSSDDDEQVFAIVDAATGEVVPGLSLSLPARDGLTITLSHPSGTLDDDADSEPQEDG